MPKLPTIPGLSRIGKLIKVPGFLKFRSLPSIPGLSQISRLPGFPGLSKLGKVSQIPFLSRIPKRTLLILIGCVVVIAIALPLILSLSKGVEEQTETEVAIEATEKAPVNAIEEPAEEAPVELAEEPPNEEPLEPEAAEPEETVAERVISPEEYDALAAQLEEANNRIADMEAELEILREFTRTPTITNIGGIITEDATWAKANSPYIITATVQIPSEVTLTIEPGVIVTMPTDDDMFTLKGVIKAHGTPDEPIVFDGEGNSNFFSAKNSGKDAILDLEYCEIRNGLSFWPYTGQQQRGAFSLKHSKLTNLSTPAYIDYPQNDIRIEYNTFINAAGFSTVHMNSIKVYIQYNRFAGKHPKLPALTDFWIQNRGSLNESQTIVKYNSFGTEDGMALKLTGDETASITAAENYWGTLDVDVIDSMIDGAIEYQPILTEPHPETPTPNSE